MRSEVRNLARLDYFASGLTRASIFDHAKPDEEFRPSFRIYGPVTALENYVGIGGRIKVNSNFNLRIKAGLGYNFYLGPDHYQPYDLDYFN